MSSETGSAFATAAHPSFVHRHSRKLTALVFWFVLLGVYQLYSWRIGLTPLEAAQYLIDFMATGVVGALIYVAFYVSSRLVLFPPTLLTIASGFVFGPVWGVVLTVLGSNAAAVVSYLMGRYFGQGLLDPGETSGAVGRYAGRMRKNGFESVLLMRLVYAPFDAVSILAGFLRIDRRQFVLATLLGSLPCILSLVLFGASLEKDFAGGGFELNPWILLASALLFVGSLLLSRYLKRGAISRSGAG